MATRTTRFKSLSRLWPLMRDPRIPFWAKAADPAVAAAYVISPIDLIPDFVLGLGSTDTDGRAKHHRPLRRRQVRLRLRPRREPPRRQLADGDDHLRPPSRAAPQRSGRSSHTTIDVPGVARAETPSGSSRISSIAPPASARGRSATSSAESMLENFGVFRSEDKMVKQREILAGAAGALPRNVYVEDKGEVLNSDLTQAIELGNMLDTAACMIARPGIVRKESRGAHSRPYASGWATTRTSCSTRSTRWRDGGVELSTGALRVDEMGARGAEVLMRAPAAPARGAARARSRAAAAASRREASSTSARTAYVKQAAQKSRRRQARVAT